jgi:hypothetical protein
VSSEATTESKIEWQPVLVTCIGVAVLLLGAWGFYQRGKFGLGDALACGLLLIPAAALLLLTSYVFQHARLAVVFPLFMAGVLVCAYPPFAVALGLALVGATVGPALRGRQRR